MLRALQFGLLILFCLLTGRAGAGQIDRDLVPDATTAIRVGSVLMESYLGKADYEAMLRNVGPIKAELQGDSWVVYAWPTDAGKEIKLPNGGTTITVMVGGGPAFLISKHDCQVRDITYSK